VGRDLGEGKATSVIVGPAETEHQARGRIVSLLAYVRMKRLSSACIKGPQTMRGRTSTPTSEMAAALADVEVVGDDVHVQEPKNKQRESDHANECEHNHDEACESVGREVSRATRKPPALCGRRRRFVGYGPT
jgi:hypothetical protein